MPTPVKNCLSGRFLTNITFGFHFMSYEVNDWSQNEYAYPSEKTARQKPT
jgi:hypothetical protein